MQALNRMLTQRPLHLLAGTLVLALAAGVAQTASAQGQPGPGWQGGPGGPGWRGGPGAPEGMGQDWRMGPGQGMGPGQHMRRGMVVERMLRAINATPEQRAKIHQILVAARADLMAQREGGRKLHQQMQALFAQPVVDAAAAEGLRQSMSAQRDQASKRMLKVRLDIAAVLTPEQRKRLGDRQAMMERHRAEREALDKPAPR